MHRCSWKAVVAAAGCLGVLAMRAAQADQWLLSSSISERLLVNSNIRLSTTDQQAVFGSISTLNGALAWSNPRASVNASAFAGISRYVGDSDLNNESFGLNLQSLYRLPRGSIGLGASITRASTINTEAFDAGNFRSVTNQLSVSIFPSWQYELSPIETVSVSGRYARQIFDSDEFADSSNYGISASWRRQLSAVESISIGARASYIETGGAASSGAPRIVRDSRSQSYGAFLGWSTSFTPNLSFSVTAGPRLSVVTGGARSSDSGDVSIGADVDLVLSYIVSERTTLVAAAGQTIEPSSTGQIQERQRVSLSVQHQISRYWDMSLTGVLQHNGRTFAGGTDTGDDGRIFVSAAARFSYRFSPTLSASFHYDFRAQDRSANQGVNSSSGFAHSHGAAIVLTYSPRAWILGN